MMRAAVAVATALLFMAAEPSCGEQKKKEPNDPITQALADLPLPLPPPNLPPNGNGRKHALEGVVFVIRVLDINLKHNLNKRVGLRATGWGADGKVPTVTDKETGVTTPQTHVLTFTTPWKYQPRLEPGVVAISIQVIYALGHVGDWLVCYTLVNGVRVTGDDMAESLVQVKSMGRDDDIGRLAVATCTYVETGGGSG